jgi:excisionase family DNA binding protein
MLSTSDFAGAIGISESSVRRLADSGELEIHRTRGGHRRIPVSEAIRYVRETGTRVLRPDILGLVESDDVCVKKSDADRLLDALREGHASGVISVMQSMYASGHSIAAICDGPIRNAMLAIGNRWPSDKKSIFIEHRATLLCMRALCQIRMAIPNPDEDAPTAMGGAPQDDPYLLPSLMVSLVLHDCGYEETNLGPNTPIDILTDSVEDEKPALVWLALTNPVRSRHQNREIDRLSATVQSYGGTFLIGGNNANSYEGEDVERCGTMSELYRRAVVLATQQ